jgi:hypothetical protein
MRMAHYPSLSLPTDIAEEPGFYLCKKNQWTLAKFIYQHIVKDGGL